MMSQPKGIEEAVYYNTVCVYVKTKTFFVLQGDE